MAKIWTARVLALCALLACALASGGPATSASTVRPAATQMPKGWQASNLKPLAYIRVDPTSTRAFKMSMKRVGDLWYLFVA
ncbi:MAG: hypothetical protein JWP92_666, partial [Caulobacter sp.]|nr:hypothetical protein [Caulobacter sp.]